MNPARAGGVEGMHGDLAPGELREKRCACAGQVVRWARVRSDSSAPTWSLYWIDEAGLHVAPKAGGPTIDLAPVTQAASLDQTTDSLRAAIDWYRASFWDGARGRLPRAKVDLPTLVVWGDKEQHLNAALADPPEDWVSNARVVHIPEASHWVHHDAPEKVAALLIEHFAGAGAGETRET